MINATQNFEAALLKAETTLSTLGITYWENKLLELREKLQKGCAVVQVAREVKMLYGGFGSIVDNAVDLAYLPKNVSMEEANGRLFHSLSELFKAANALDQ